ncbi:MULTISPECIES: hypothetical protein [unclassified Novosphingobium]|uniref:hypothetical protein n=1 Tax=unclassified Novosphingobium TaxID=2644732 RepID=UPI00181272F2|nr:MULTISPECIES: hypothetical protein [unclassified Novosphingobium]NMN85582.1 hypothetical protein [Novosphingobium sp. SG916]
MKRLLTQCSRDVGNGRGTGNTGLNGQFAGRVEALGEATMSRRWQARSAPDRGIVAGETA